MQLMTTGRELSADRLGATGEGQCGRARLGLWGIGFERKVEVTG